MLLCTMHASCLATEGSSNKTVSTEKITVLPLRKVATSTAGALSEAVECAVPWRIGTYLIDKFLAGCIYVRTKSLGFSKSWLGKMQFTGLFRTLCKVTGVFIVIAFFYDVYTKIVAEEAPPVTCSENKVPTAGQQTFTISQPA